MKNTLAFLFTCFILKPSFSQEKELLNFQKCINYFIDFQLGKIDSLPVNASNQAKLRKEVDESFVEFGLHPQSQNYEKLVQVKNDESQRYMRLDERVSVYAKDFLIGKEVFTVFSYTSRDKKNYLIKAVAKNQLVYQGNSTNPFVEALYSLDAQRVLLVEKAGDRNTSRSVFVLDTHKNPWQKTKAFQGHAFGQVPGDYLQKKYQKAREEFQLICEDDIVYSYPADINKINFDTARKEISFKKFFSNNRFEIVKAQWNYGMFTIDDYSVSENLPVNGNAVPE